MVSWSQVGVGVVVLLLFALGGASAYAWTPDIPIEQLKARWAKPPSQFIEVDGVQVHYRDEGPQDATLSCCCTAEAIACTRGTPGRSGSKTAIASFALIGLGSD